METRADRIRYIREVLLGGISQHELADLLDVERGAVGNWERGKGISRRNIGKLASKADVSIDWIETGLGQRPQRIEEPPPASPVLSDDMIPVHRRAAIMAFAAAFCRLNARISPHLAQAAATQILDALVSERIAGFRVDLEAMAVGMGDATVALFLQQADQKQPS